MIIAPEIIVTPDRPVVRFREPSDKVDLNKELQRVLNAQGWGVGTYFNVQFLSHDRADLLSQAEFVVTRDAEELQTSDDQYSPKTRTGHIKEVEQLGEFRVFGGGLDDLEGEEVQVVAPDRVSALEDELTEMRAEIEVLKKPKRTRRSKEQMKADADAEG